MASSFTILCGSYHKIVVRAVNAEITGIYDMRDKTITRPDITDIEHLIPYRYRRAFKRSNGRFWFNNETRINSEGRTIGDLPYLDLYYANNKPMIRLYAIAH